MIDQHAVVSAFVAALASNGVTLADPDKIRLSGKWERATVAGDKSGSGNLSYRIFFDEHPAGYFEDHKRGVSGTFSCRNGQDTDPAAIAESARVWAAKQAQRERETLAAQAKAAKLAVKMFAAASPIQNDASEYLTRKRLTPSNGVRIDATGSLLVPVFAKLGGPIVSLQIIAPDGEKRFLPRGRMSGCFHPIIGTDKRRVLICEGYATGVALAAATGHSVACAMSAGQLKAVADYCAGKFPDRELIVMADNDRNTTGNLGVTAANATGRRFIAPNFPDGVAGTDWDDWLRNTGDPSALLALLAAAESPVSNAPANSAPGPDVAAYAPTSADALKEPLAPLPAKPSALYDRRSVWHELNLQLSATRQPIPNLDNAVRALSNHPRLAGHIWRDDFLQRTMTKWTGDGSTREWTDDDDSALCIWFQRTLGIHKFSTNVAREAARIVALLNPRNCVTEWLDSLTWDSTPRLTDLIARGFGAPTSEYSSAVGRVFICGMVARAYSPGCQLDTMPVFEGPQGINKSSALRIIGGGWYAELKKSPEHTDFYQCLQGVWLGSLDELESLGRSSIETMRAAITCRNDRYRASYGRHAGDHPRQCALAGTVNGSEWNKDEHGARRFHPVSCGAIDLEWIATNREQIFAEAVAIWKGEQSLPERARMWWRVPDEDAKREQDARRFVDTWEEIIASYLVLIGRSEVTVGELLTEALHVPIERHEKQNQMRVARALTILGWSRSVAWRNHKPVRLWTARGGKAEDSRIP